MKDKISIESQDSSNIRLCYQFTGYIEKVVTHAKCNYIKSKKRIYENEELTDSIPDRIIHQCSQVDDFFSEDRKPETIENAFINSILYKAVQELTPIKKQLLFYLIFENIRINEIADHLNCSSRWVKRMKRQIFDLFKKDLEKTGGDQ